MGEPRGSDVRGAPAPAGDPAARRHPARPGARDRPDRRGQDDHARRDDRLHQPNPSRTHHHHRGPDRVPAPRQEVASSTSARSGADTPTFAAALRAALRQDPDVILVGEMRDRETVETALQRGRDRPPGVLDAAHDRRDRDRLRIVELLPADTRRRADPLAGALRGVVSHASCRAQGRAGRIPPSR